MKKQDKNRTNTKSGTKKSNANSKSKNTLNGLPKKTTESAGTRRNTRGKAKKPKNYINFIHLQELCHDHFGDSIDINNNADIYRCINELSEEKNLDYSTTEAMIGKYKNKKSGINSNTLFLLASCFGENINPYYLIEGQNSLDLKFIPDNENERFMMMVQILSEKKIKKAAPVIQVASILGYNFTEIDGCLYLQIPEKEKANIPFHNQWIDYENGLKLPNASFEYLITQLESTLYLFESTMLNYYKSNLAAMVNMDIDRTDVAKMFGKVLANNNESEPEPEPEPEQNCKASEPEPIKKNASKNNSGRKTNKKQNHPD